MYIFVNDLSCMFLGYVLCFFSFYTHFLHHTVQPLLKVWPMVFLPDFSKRIAANSLEVCILSVVPGSESSTPEQLTQNDSPIFFVRGYKMIATVCMDLHVSVELADELCNKWSCMCSFGNTLLSEMRVIASYIVLKITV